jgi:hypothetical protein
MICSVSGLAVPALCQEKQVKLLLYSTAVLFAMLRNLNTLLHSTHWLHHTISNDRPHRQM